MSENKPMVTEVTRQLSLFIKKYLFEKDATKVGVTPSPPQSRNLVRTIQSFRARLWRPLLFANVPATCRTHF